MKRNILITGVAGLLGSRLADWIIKNKPEYDVIGIDDLSGGYIDNVNEEVIFYTRNLNSDILSDIFEKYNPEYVFHFAAYAAEGLSPFIRNFNYKNNIISTTSIVNECIKHDVKRLIFTSTMAVYGRGIPPFNEDMIPNPIDPYGIAKYACEMDIKVAGEQHGLDWCIIRPHNVYGVKQNIWDKYRNVLGIWMYQNLNGLPMSIFGDGEQTRAFSFIDDTTPCLWESAVRECASKQIINVGGKSHISLNNANEILRKIMGSGTVSYKESRHEVKNAYVTWEKSVELLDYKENYSLEEGLEIMWNWAKTQPNRDRFEWESFEVDKGIYSFWKK